MKSDLERVPSGIPGFDQILGGGIIKGSLLLLAGVSGTGKTVCATQIAYKNALEGRKALIASFDEGKALIKYMRGFGWNLQKLIDEDKMKILDYVAPTEKIVYDIISDIVTEIKSWGAEILVIDSLTSMILTVPELSKARALTDFLRKIKPEEVTVIATANIFHGSRRIGVGVEEVVADTLVLLKRSFYKSEFITKLYVLKVRGSSHSRKAHQLIFTPNGVEVSPLPLP